MLLTTSLLSVFYEPVLKQFGLEFDVIKNTQMVKKGKECIDVYLACLDDVLPQEALVIEDKKRERRVLEWPDFKLI